MLDRHAVERAKEVGVHPVVLARCLRDASAGDSPNGLGLEVQRLAARLIESSEVDRVNAIRRRGYDLRQSLVSTRRTKR